MSFLVLTFSGVSAQSFIQAFTLAQSAFNVQLASPNVSTSQQSIITTGFVTVFLNQRLLEHLFLLFLISTLE